MTNVSLVDSIKSGTRISCKRYNTVNKLLSESVYMNVEKAFEILEAVKQSEGEWITEFSMVYDKSKQTIYYCYNQDFENIQEFLFQ